MSMSFKASPDGTYGEILVNGQVVAKLPVSGNAVIPNLVGTVSQSGGIPTGAVVERGSNANGAYVRFADGTQICYMDFQGAFSVSQTGFANLYSADIDFTFPSVFVGEPCASGSGIDNITVAVSVSPWFITTVGCKVRYLTPTSVISGTDIRILAVGRWF